ncbi:MAG: phosphoribosyl-AMP cyclohydrolase [Pseudomonadota bacterium]
MGRNHSEPGKDDGVVDQASLVQRVLYNAQSLVMAISQQHDTGEVLMMAWMNAHLLTETLTTRRVCYWSRSRQALWRKGETSDHHQRLVDWRLEIGDCDGNTIILLVGQT